MNCYNYSEYFSLNKLREQLCFVGKSEAPGINIKIKMQCIWKINVSQCTVIIILSVLTNLLRIYQPLSTGMIPTTASITMSTTTLTNRATRINMIFSLWCCNSIFTRYFLPSLWNSFACNKTVITGNIIVLYSFTWYQNFLQYMYCKREYFRWGEISRKCCQDLSRGGNFRDTKHISLIRS